MSDAYDCMKPDVPAPTRTQKQRAKALLLQLQQPTATWLKAMEDLIDESQNRPALGGMSDSTITEGEWYALYDLHQAAKKLLQRCAIAGERLIG